MKRREFIASAAALAAFPRLALAQRRFEMPYGADLWECDETLPGLISWFEKHFACQMGEPKAYMEIPVSGGLHRVVYRVFALAYEPGDDETYNATCDRALIYCLHNAFAMPLMNHPELRGSRLYWRNTEKITLDTWIGDNSVSMRRIWARLALWQWPEDLTGDKPEGQPTPVLKYGIV